MMRLTLPLAGALAAFAVPAAAAQIVVAGVDGSGDGATLRAAVLNDAASPATVALPATLPATVSVGGRSIAATIARAPGQPASVTVPAGGFATVRYRLALPAGTAGGMVSVPAWGPTALALAPSAGTRLAATDETAPEAVAPPPQVAAAAAPRDLPPAPAPGEPAPPEPPLRSASNDRGNAFLRNLSAYRPIYAVYGPGTDSDARLQISFKYQLFGDPADGPGRSWLDGIHFAFTQRLYWDLGAESSPFRNVDYEPELFYLFDARPVGSSGLTIGGQAGFQHDSNGRAGADSRSYNTLYVQPVATLPLGEGHLTLGPRAWVYLGSRDDNPDIRRYRGNTGLFAQWGTDDGVRVSAEGRLNFTSGRGAVDALVSYPLGPVIFRSLKLYAFGQGFEGYGEDLLDYRRHQTRLRVGIGITR